jgi:hypothetical protein
MAKIEFNKLYSGRTDKRPAWKVFEEVFDLVWGKEFHSLPTFPEVTEGVSGNWLDTNGNTHNAENLDEIRQAYNYVEEEIEDFTLIGDVGGHAILMYYPKTKEIHFQIRSYDKEKVAASLKIIQDYFPLSTLKSSASPTNATPYVHLERIEELKKIHSDELDLTVLIRFCEELNIAFFQECFFSTLMLVRSIMNHVPPIFEKETFAQVAASYGRKSFKESMSNLERSSRKIADSYLHSQIRDKEVLPNSNQVQFIPELDVLLSEVVRLLKK